MSDTPEMTDILQFIELRAPFSPEAKSLRRNYIYDDVIGFRNDQPTRIDVDLQSETSPSVIGRLVYMYVFCDASINDFLAAVLNLLPPYQPPCYPSPLPSGVRPLLITELERRAYIDFDGMYYLLPERLEQIEALVLPELLRAYEEMETARKNFNLSKLAKELQAVFGGAPLRKIVFKEGIYAESFGQAKRTLFDTLYLLYILRRRTSVNLESTMEGLRVLHTLEALAVDELVSVVKAGQLSQEDKLLRRTLEGLFPELQGWNGSDPLLTLPLIHSIDDFEAYFTATPVIHPIFARLRYYKLPFNTLKPIGIGDLKVVKQWLIAYLPGEIAYIENVLKGEFKNRTHRRLEKTEESFSFSSSSREWSQKDMQATERLELKREVENVVKTELSLGANANVTYNYQNGMIIANVGANFSYKRDATEQSKTSATFGRETVAKAVQQIEKTVTETRSITKLFETEETNKHGFDNKTGKRHVTGIYRWLDKKYKARLFNFGKRMMFEFMIPEPAAFFAESRLRAFESTLECPQPPQAPVLKTVSLAFQPSDIDETKFQELRQRYDLAEFVFLPRTRGSEFIDSSTDQNLFSAKGLDSTVWNSKTYSCKLSNAKGYTLTKLNVTGRMHFWGKFEPGLTDQNTVEVSIDGQRLVRVEDNTLEYWVYNPGKDFAVNSTPFGSDDVKLHVGFWDIADYELSFHAELTIGAHTLLDWQTQVFNKVRAIEQQRVDKENQELQLAYNSQMSEYRNRIAELKATSVNDLLQGQSEAFNRELIRTELKKHGLTLITKEFDADGSDDVYAFIDAVKGRSGDFTSRRFKVVEDLTHNTTTCSFEVTTKTIDYPSIALPEAATKGKFVQFLEQAFEWQHMAYLFYPYFWANQPDWITMMNRLDDADPNMTAFLQAGSAKVLLAVTPAYEEAVLHFLATGEPWEGGPAPVIGDPLFIPLHEELRKRQDDLYNAVPEGEPWTFILPTSLIYLEDSGATLPTFPDIPTS
jgi:hypothetical protein